MPQINLLGQDNRRYSTPWLKGPLYAVRLFVVLFILVIAYWGYLYVRTRVVTKQAATIQEQIKTTQKDILADTSRRELLVRQGQLQAADGLLTEHAYWSRLLPELARTTLRTASYIAFSADSAGVAHLSVTVPSYKDFDQFLQVFDLKEFNSHFSQITVSSVGKYQQGDAQLVRFEVALHYDKSFLKGASTNQTNSVSQ